ncbi:unnamed protein product [Tilletia controversa]|nr:hypothetical protein CF328_g8452 [Tilletia controversa]KAE8193686.1 hypothetical protein CF336_g3878 [Tilletia laevis]CAD6900681.1 unnamed protein product [Tilletia caries]CAD6903385.1 unnamed protein product [Tilletia caries]CAD6905177.1 unnamed protein product [Tilletia controversa]
MLSLFAALLLVLPVQAALRGAPWGADSAWSPPVLGGNSSVSWYHHWQAGPISSASPNVEFVPMMWGPKKPLKWAKRKAEMALHPPAHLLAFNEPDVPSQANLTPSAALDLYMAELWPLKRNFTSMKLSSPQICYNLTWLDQFMTGAQALHAEPDFLAVHWYGPPKLAKFQAYLNKIHAKYLSKGVWVTETGLTNAANVTAPQAMDFMLQMLNWTDSQPFIKRVTWTGFFGLGSPPDAYISPAMALFYANGTLRDLGIVYTSPLPSAAMASINPDRHDGGKGGKRV